MTPLPDLLCVEQSSPGARLVIRNSTRLACWAWLHVLRTGEVPRSEHEAQVFAALELADAKARRNTQEGGRPAFGDPGVVAAPRFPLGVA